MVDRDLAPPGLLGTHVRGGADEVTADRETLLSFESGEAEVEDAEPSARVEDQVGGFDVPVDNSLRVGVLEALGDVDQRFSQIAEVRDLVLRLLF